MNNAITIYQDFDNLQRAAIALQKSGYFTDVKSEAQAIVKVMAGAEIGIPPFASMTGIHIIQGKPVLGANVLATLVKNDPRYNYHVKTATNEVCEIEWLEGGKVVGETGFTMDEAKAAGLTGKDSWKKYPSDMLFARAISRGARRYAPGIFGGAPVYTPDEMGADVDEDGNVVVVEVEEVKEVKNTERQDKLLEGVGLDPSLTQQQPTNGMDAVYQSVVDAGLSDNVHAAKQLLTNYCRTGYDTPEKAIAWAKLYRGWKDAKFTTVEAAQKANAGESA